MTVLTVYRISTRSCVRICWDNGVSSIAGQCARGQEGGSGRKPMHFEDRANMGIRGMDVVTQRYSLMSGCVRKREAKGRDEVVEY